MANRWQEELSNQNVDYSGVGADEASEKFMKYGKKPDMHNILEWAGMIPGLPGLIADAANLGSYAKEEDTSGMLWSAGSMIPLLGLGIGAGKKAKKGHDVINEIIKRNDEGLKKLRKGKETAEQKAKRKKYWGDKKAMEGGYEEALPYEHAPIEKTADSKDYFKSFLDDLFESFKGKEF